MWTDAPDWLETGARLFLGSVLVGGFLAVVAAVVALPWAAYVDDFRTASASAIRAVLLDATGGSVPWTTLVSAEARSELTSIVKDLEHRPLPFDVTERWGVLTGRNLEECRRQITLQVRTEFDQVAEHLVGGSHDEGLRRAMKEHHKAKGRLGWLGLKRMSPALVASYFKQAAVWTSYGSPIGLAASVFAAVVSNIAGMSVDVPEAAVWGLTIGALGAATAAGYAFALRALESAGDEDDVREEPVSSPPIQNVIRWPRAVLLVAMLAFAGLLVTVAPSASEHLISVSDPARFSTGWGRLLLASLVGAWALRATVRILWNARAEPNTSDRFKSLAVAAAIAFGCMGFAWFIATTDVALAEDSSSADGLPTVTIAALLVGVSLALLASMIGAGFSFIEHRAWCETVRDAGVEVTFYLPDDTRIWVNLVAVAVHVTMLFVTPQSWPFVGLVLAALLPVTLPVLPIVSFVRARFAAEELNRAKREYRHRRH